MEDFKVGDLVEIVDDVDGFGDMVGRTGEITGFSHLFCEVKVAERGVCSWPFYSRELKPSKPEQGNPWLAQFETD